MQKYVSVLAAQDKLSSMCGFEEIVPRMWVGPVNAMTPDNGTFISWDALFMEAAEGISFDDLTLSGGRQAGGRKKLLPADIIRDLLFNKCGCGMCAV